MIYKIADWWVAMVLGTIIAALALDYGLREALEFAVGFSFSWWTVEAFKVWWNNPRRKPPHGGAA